MSNNYDGLYIVFLKSVDIESYVKNMLVCKYDVIVVIGFGSESGKGMLYSIFKLNVSLVSMEDLVFIILGVLGCNVFVMFYFIG